MADCLQNIIEFGYSLFEEIEATGNCSDSTLWERLIAARTKAIRAFRTDLSAAVNTTHRHVLQTKDRMIGRVQATSTNAVGSTYAGVTLKPNPYRDAKFVLQAVYLGLDTSTDVTITIKTNSEDIANASTFTEQTLSITTQANKFVRKALGTPLELPFYSIQNPDDLKYFIYYEMATAHTG